MKIPFDKTQKKLDKKQKRSGDFFNQLNEFLNLKKGNKKVFIIIAVIFIVFPGILSLSFTLTSPSNTTNHSKISTVTLGKTNDSSVVKEGPYANSSSNVTIAYVVGVHPRESVHIKQLLIQCEKTVQT